MITLYDLKYYLICNNSISVIKELEKMNIHICIISSKYERDIDSMRSVLNQFRFPNLNIICCGNQPKDEKIKEIFELNEFENLFIVDQDKFYLNLLVKNIYNFTFSKIIDL